MKELIKLIRIFVYCTLSSGSSTVIFFLNKNILPKPTNTLDNLASDFSNAILFPIILILYILAIGISELISFIRNIGAGSKIIKAFSIIFFDFKYSIGSFHSLPC